MISSSRTIARASGALLAILLLGSLGVPRDAAARTWPKPQGYASDFAGVLDAASRDSIDALAAELREKTGAELAVATTPDLGDDDIDAAAVDLFKAWGVGNKSKDEGVLILLAQKERRVRIEVGYGLEGILPDGLCGSIIRHVMAPDLSAGRYGPGLLQGARAVAGVIAKDRGVTITGAIQPPSEDDGRGGGMTPRSAFMIALIIAIVLSNILRAGARRRGWMGRRGPWWWGGGGPGGYGGMFGGFGGMGGGFGGGFGGGGGGGGFGGFGGGRSGGGGASGGF